MDLDVDNDLSWQLAQALRAVQSRDDFIATAAHELRTPMHALALQLEVTGRLFDRGEPTRARAELAKAQRILQRFLKRSTTLLDVSRLNDNCPMLEFEAFDLVELIGAAAEDLAEDARAHGVDVVIQTPPSLPVRWNRHGAEMVLSNLLTNALRYAPGQPVRLGARLLPETDRVVVSVADHGPGIAAADRQRVFAKFERLGPSRPAQPGFGLGLWIVGRVVAAHHGEVLISDAPGGGTCFEVTLPRDPLSLSQERPPSP